ncbi:MAG: hypothetical protein V1493_01320, partial [Candidatus Diapherotrites archaeon]
YGAQGTATAQVSVKQRPVITGFKVRTPLTPETEAHITINCTKTGAPLKIEIFDNKGNPITTDTSGNEIPITKTTPPPTCTGQLNGPKLPTGIYLIKATMLGADGNPDPECTNCPKTTNIVVGEKMQEVQTPEMPAILAAGIALIVVLVVNRKK